MLIICFGVIFTDMVAYGVISPSLPSLARALSATDAQMGYAFAGYPVALTVAILPLGALVDRFGRNWLIIAVSMVALAGSTTMIAYASTISTLIAARALQGVSSAAAWVATQPLIAGPVGPDGRQKHSMSLVTTAAGLGVIVGPLLGGIGQLETPFLINGALAFLWAIAAAALSCVSPFRRW